MQYLAGTIIFLFGASLGSFVLVIAERYNTGLSFFKGRSICFSCGQKLRSRDLFPVFSFLALRGRCRHCQAKISSLAFWVEVVMGGLAVLAAQKAGILADFQFVVFNLQTIFNFLILNSIFATILLISVYDLKHFIIPDSFLLVLLFLAFLHNSLFMIHNSFLFSFLSAIIVTLPFLLIFLVSRGRWLGFGDVKYMLVLGFWLGLAGGVSAIMLSFWIGAAFSLAALSLKRLNSHMSLPLLPDNLTIKSEIPFGPFLSLGLLISFLSNADFFQINSLLNAF